MIGRRNTLVTIQAPGTDVADSGATDPWKSPTTFATEWAEVQPLRGREFFAAQQTTSEVTLKVIIRFRDDVTPRMRVTFGSHTLSISSVQPDYVRKRETVLMCAELA